jgi:hypothetical protein
VGGGGGGERWGKSEGQTNILHYNITFSAMRKDFTHANWAGNVCKSWGNLKLLKVNRVLKGQSHEKVGELRVWRGSLGPN